MKLSVLVLSCALTLTTYVYGALQQAATVSATGSSVTGLVVDAMSGEPLSNITVWAEPAVPVGPATISGDAVATGASDDTGRFRFSAPPGEIRIFAEGAGFVRGEYGQLGPNRPGTRLVLPPGQQAQIAIRLYPTSSISGRVLDQEQRPVSGLTMVARIVRHTPRGRTVEDLRDTGFGTISRSRPPISLERGYGVTGETGEYELHGLPPGDYYVVARRDDGESAPIYFPGSAQLSGGTAIRSGVGSRLTDIDVEWRDVPLVAVRGRAVTPDATPYPGLTLRVLTPEGTRVRSALVDMREDAMFEVFVPPMASYVLTAASLPSNDGLFGALSLSVGERDLENVNVVLAGVTDIEGQVISEFAFVPDDFNAVSVGLRWSSDGSAGRNYARVMMDGTFRLRGVSGRNDYTLVVDGLPDGVYIDSATFGATDLLTELLDLSRELQSSIITVRLATGTGDIHGRVVNGRGDAIAGAQVLLIPDESTTRRRSDRLRSSQSGPAGTFTFESVPPGVYRVYAWEVALENGAEWDDAFISGFIGQSQRFQLKRDTTIDVDDLHVITR